MPIARAVLYIVNISLLLRYKPSVNIYLVIVYLLLASKAIIKLIEVLILSKLG